MEGYSKEQPKVTHTLLPFEDYKNIIINDEMNMIDIFSYNEHISARCYTGAQNDEILAIVHKKLYGIELADDIYYHQFKKEIDENFTYEELNNFVDLFGGSL